MTEVLYKGIYKDFSDIDFTPKPGNFINIKTDEWSRNYIYNDDNEWSPLELPQLVKGRFEHVLIPYSDYYINAKKKILDKGLENALKSTISEDFNKDFSPEQVMNELTFIYEVYENECRIHP